MNEQSGHQPNQPGGPYQGPSFGQQPQWHQPQQTQQSQQAQQSQQPQQPPGQPPYGSSAPQPPRRRRNPALVIGSLALAAVIGAGTGIGSYALLDPAPQQSPVSVTGEQPPQQQNQQNTVEAAAATISPSVVTITVSSGGSGAVGSGVVLDKQGHILTNAHVVTGMQSAGSMPPFGDAASSGTAITVTLKDGTTAKATVVGVDQTDDLAVIKVDGVENLNPATFAKSDSLQVGQTVVAVGAPLGLSQTVTSGIVSNTARPVRSGTGGEAVYLAVQTDAAINHGNSGGPLVDLNGNVVGINSAIASGDDQSSGNIGIGFAIPADEAVRVANDLIEDGESADARLGVTIHARETGALGSSTAGVPLQSVQSGSAAARAGLERGDVITEVGDYPVTTANGLIAAIRSHAPGTTVQITYERDGEQQTVDVTLGSA